MFDHFLRILKDRWMAPVARWLGPAVPPNVITLLGGLIGFASAGAVLKGWLGAALALWIVNRVLDGLDGSLARVHGRQSDFGGYLDIVVDFLVYAVLPIAMVGAAPANDLASAGLLLVASFFVNAASWMYLAAILERRSVGAASRGELTTITMPPGIVAGTETFLFYAAFIALPTIRHAGFLLMAALVGVNVLQRLFWAYRHLRQSAA